VHLQHDLIALVLGLCRQAAQAGGDQAGQQCQNQSQFHGWIMDKAEAKKALRKALIEERLHLPDRLARAEALQRVMRIWLFDRPTP
jgi:hypothetical protein